MSSGWERIRTRSAFAAGRSAPHCWRRWANINGDVQEALADERARLSDHGYPEDLPLPALWWSPAPAAKKARVGLVLAAVDA